MAFREIGKGHVDIETFCGLMNMPHPMNVKAYNNMVKDIMLPIYNTLVKEDMKEAAEELRQQSVHVADITVDRNDDDGDKDENNDESEEDHEKDENNDESEEDYEKDENGESDEDDEDDTAGESNKNNELDDGMQNDNVCDISASFDGTWQRRGYASLNGVVSAISIDTGKCLSYDCLTKNCKACET